MSVFGLQWLMLFLILLFLVIGINILTSMRKKKKDIQNDEIKATKEKNNNNQ